MQGENLKRKKCVRSDPGELPGGSKKFASDLVVEDETRYRVSSPEWVNIGHRCVPRDDSKKIAIDQTKDMPKSQLLRFEWESDYYEYDMSQIGVQCNAMYGDQKAGYIIGTIYESPDMPACIVKLYVKSQHRCLGIGTLLLQHFLSKYGETRAVNLDVISDKEDEFSDIELRNFYTRWGFNKVKVDFMPFFMCMHPTEMLRPPGPLPVFYKTLEERQLCRGKC